MSLTTEQNIKYKNYILCSSCHREGFFTFDNHIDKRLICECRICGKQYKITSKRKRKDKEHETNNRTM